MLFHSSSENDLENIHFVEVDWISSKIMKIPSEYDDITKAPLTREESSLHFMTMPRSTNVKDWDPHLTLTSPVKWEMSPLTNQVVTNSTSTNEVTPSNQREQKNYIIANGDISQFSGDDEEEEDNAVRPLLAKEENNNKCNGKNSIKKHKSGENFSITNSYNGYSKNKSQINNHQQDNKICSTRSTDMANGNDNDSNPNNNNSENCPSIQYRLVHGNNKNVSPNCARKVKSNSNKDKFNHKMDINDSSSDKRNSKNSDIIYITNIDDNDSSKINDYPNSKHDIHSDSKNCDNNALVNKQTTPTTTTTNNSIVNHNETTTQYQKQHSVSKRIRSCSTPSSSQRESSSKIRSNSSRKPRSSYREESKSRSQTAKETGDYYSNGPLYRKESNSSVRDTYSKNFREPFIVVNVPENAFTKPQHTNNAVPSIADDITTVISDAVKCRYCLTNDTGHTSEPLISPCQCCGTSKYVHKSCLEKWLNLRDLDACEVCKTSYRTKWVHRRLCSMKFPRMKKHDIFLLLATTFIYITLIFQLLGTVYIAMMSDSLQTMVTIVTLIGLALGLFWFLAGSIALTIILYSSNYWKAWRYANKKKVLILESEESDNVNGTNQTFPPQDLSMAVAV